VNDDNTATFQDWADALYSLSRSPSERRSFPCPNCGVRALQIVYVGNPESHVGYCSLWCDNCRYGIQPSRVIIPDGVDFFPFSTDPDVVAAAIPDFREVYPDEDVDDEDEEEGDEDREMPTR
jgi:transcription elongation factor Elf1